MSGMRMERGRRYLVILYLGLQHDSVLLEWEVKRAKSLCLDNFTVKPGKGLSALGLCEEEIVMIRGSLRGVGGGGRV